MKKAILLLFGISGAVGLMYQVVWARQILLIFGNTTHSLVTILSVFMGGLALGSAIFGYLADRIRNQLRFWAILEFCIGISALVFLFLLPVVRELYAPSSLFFKFLASSVMILPATFFMGGTLPVLIKYFSSYSKKISAETSQLYFVNTLGAFLGTLFSAFVMIEVFGLFNSIIIGALVNAVIGVLALFLSKKEFPQKARKEAIDKRQATLDYDPGIIFFVLFVFFLSGAISFSYEILWTRLLIPSLGTFVYAFAIILSVILFGISIGAILANRFLEIGKRILLFGKIEIAIGFFAFLSLLASGKIINLPTPLKLVAVLIPTSILMGMTFPIVASFFKDLKKAGTNIGGAYAVNTAGSIVGPIITGFILIPTIGSTQTLICLSLINIFMGLILVLLEKKRPVFLPLLILAISLFIVWIGTNYPDLLIEKSTAERIVFYKEKGWEYELYEDEVATSLAFSGSDSPDEKGLIIDSVQTTTLTTQTKLLAHLPLLLHTDPQDLLVIAFGMGTTFRSALSYDINVDAVELVPSVPETFSLFFEDAEKVVSDPKGKIIINDGRNYVLFTGKKYDIVVVDPPPPINAAGTTVLYSKEFYEDSKKIMKDNGIFVQWFWYGASEDDFKMLFASFRKVFPHILIAVSPEGRGVFFLGSEEEIEIKKTQIANRLKGKALADLNEWEKTPYTINRLLNLFVGDEKTADRFIGNTKPITDNYPKTEYFYLRHKLNPLPDISADWVHPIDREFKERIGI